MDATKPRLYNVCNHHRWNEKEELRNSVHKQTSETFGVVKGQDGHKAATTKKEI